MARLPRLHRVVAVWADGTRKARNYLTPEAAETRRAFWAGEAAKDGSEASDLDRSLAAAEVSVVASYPVIWPTALDDRFDIPDMVLSRSAWNDLAARLGIKPEAVLGVEVQREHLTVTYDPKPDKPGTTAPRTWVVYIENEEG